MEKCYSHILRIIFLIQCFIYGHIVTKKEGTPRTPTGIRLTSLRLCYIHSEAHTLGCFPDLLQLEDYCAEPLQCICTARHHEQTPIDFTNQLLVLLFHKSHSDNTSVQIFAII